MCVHSTDCRVGQLLHMRECVTSCRESGTIRFCHPGARVCASGESESARCEGPAPETSRAPGGSWRCRRLASSGPPCRGRWPAPSLPFRCWGTARMAARCARSGSNWRRGKNRASAGKTGFERWPSLECRWSEGKPLLFWFWVTGG